MIKTTSSFHAQGLRQPVTNLSNPNTESAVLADEQMRRNALAAADIVHQDASVNRVWKRINTLLGGDDSSNSQLDALRRQLSTLTGEVVVQQALNHENTQNAHWMIAMTATYLDIGALNTFRAEVRAPRPDTLPELDGSSQNLGLGRGGIRGVHPVGTDPNRIVTMSSAELTDRLLALMESVEAWLLRERNLSEVQVYRSTMLQNMHIDIDIENRRKISAAYETVRAFALANQPPDGPSLDLNFANLEEPQNIERLYQIITYLEKSYHTDKIFDYSDTDAGVTDGIAAIAEFKNIRKTLFADLQNIDKSSLAIAEAQQIMNKVAQRYPANIHNNAADPRVQGSQLEAVASHEDEHHMLHILEACGEADPNAIIQKFDSYESLVMCAEGIIKKKEFRAAADHANMFTDDQFMKVFLTYFAREKMFQARNERQSAERKACGTKYDEFKRNLDKMHDGIRRRILSLTPPAFDAHGHIIQENDGRQLVELYKACPNLFYASEGSQTNNGEYAQMLCRLQAIALYEYPQLMENVSHGSPVTLAEQIAHDRINQANASHQLYYQNMTAADRREQHGWRDAVAEHVTNTTRYTGMAARFLGKPAKLLGKTFETLTKGILYVADKTIHGVAHGVEHLTHHVDHIGDDHDNKQGIFKRVLLGIPCSILSAPLSIVNAGVQGVNTVREGVEKGIHAGYHGAIHALSHSDDCKSVSDALCIACEHLGHSAGGTMSKFTRWLYDHGTHHQKQEFIENFYRRLTPEQVANLRLGYEYTQMASGIISAPTIMTDTDRVMSDNWNKPNKPSGKKNKGIEDVNDTVEKLGDNYKKRFEKMAKIAETRGEISGTKNAKEIASKIGIVSDFMISFSDNFSKLKGLAPGSIEAKILCSEIQNNFKNAIDASKSYVNYYTKLAKDIGGKSAFAGTTTAPATPATGICQIKEQIDDAEKTLSNARNPVTPPTTSAQAQSQQQQIASAQAILDGHKANLHSETEKQQEALSGATEFKSITTQINNINKNNRLNEFLESMKSNPSSPLGNLLEQRTSNLID